MIPIITNFRGIVLISIIVTGIGAYLVVNHSKSKSDYNKSTGVIEYIDQKFNNLPKRHKGKYKYLKLDSYPYTFEIYKANSEKTQNTIDDLKVGDTVDIYYYEISDTHSSKINRFTQFIDKDNLPYFIRNGFQKKLGFILISICTVINIFSVILLKKGKINW